MRAVAAAADRVGPGTVAGVSSSGVTVVLDGDVTQLPARVTAAGYLPVVGSRVLVRSSGAVLSVVGPVRASHGRQQGTVPVTFSAVSTVTGSVAFDAEFDGPPSVALCVEDPTNVGFRWALTGPSSTTGFGWRVAQLAGSPVTATPVLHWIAGA